MKKYKLKKKFIEALINNFNVSVVCEKLSISRQTYYRWRKEDEEFANKVDDSIFMGIEYVNDLAESQVVANIKDNKPWAIKEWLKNHKYNYIKPRPKSFEDYIRQKMKIQHKSKLIDQITVKFKEHEDEPGIVGAKELADKFDEVLAEDIIIEETDPSKNEEGDMKNPAS